MQWLGFGFAALAALIHVYIFALETFLWGKPKTNKLYNVTPEDAETVRVFIFNQGYYNLFLSVAIFAGFVFYFCKQETVGLTLVVYSCLSIVAAACVLLASAPHLLRAAMIQGLPPLLALLFICIAKCYLRSPE